MTGTDEEHELVVERKDSYDPETEEGTERIGSSKNGDCIVFVNTCKSSTNSTTITTRTCFLWKSSLRLKLHLPKPEKIFQNRYIKVILARYEPASSMHSLRFHNAFPYVVCFYYRVPTRCMLWHPGLTDWILGELPRRWHNIYCDVVQLESDNAFGWINLFGSLRVTDRMAMQSPNRSPAYLIRRLVQVIDSHQDEDGLFLVERRFQCPWEVWKVDLLRRSFDPVMDGVSVFISGCHSAARYPMPDYSKFKLLEGRRANFVCYTEHSDDENFYVLWLDDLSLSIFRNQPDSGFPVWFPQLKAPGKNWLAFVEDDGEQEQEQEDMIRVDHQLLSKRRKIDPEPVLDQLPAELPWCISKYFFDKNLVRYYWNFRRVCSNWREIAPPICWKPTWERRSDQSFPWLMFSDSFIDPANNIRYYYQNNSSQSNTKIQYSNNGWLLVSEGTHTIYLFEPFSKAKMNLPSLPEGSFSDSMAFSTEQERVVVSTCSTPRFRVHYLRSGDKEWNHIEMNAAFLPAGCSPACYRNTFFFLDIRGYLAIFTFKSDNSPELGMTRVPSISLGSEKFFTSYFRGYLVFCENRLYLVALLLGKFVKLHLLDPFARLWKEVKSFGGNYSVFISRTSSFGIPINECKEKQNTINFPVLGSDDRCLYYKLDASEFKFHNDGDHNSSADLYEIEESVSALWIRPRVVRAYRT